MTAAARWQPISATLIVGSAAMSGDFCGRNRNLLTESTLLCTLTPVKLSNEVIDTDYIENYFIFNVLRSCAVPAGSD